MNFTREPIIETIITPKDGYNLVVRNSKGGSHEEYHVDSVEVVSFGHSFFFRSLERPKSFLVPVGDYEIVEVKETRVVLKNVNIERSIKIGGGRQAAPVAKEVETVASSNEEEAIGEVSSQETTPAAAPAKGDRKRDRRRNRRGRRSSQEERGVTEAAPKKPQQAEPIALGGGGSDETQVSSSMFSSLFPPPPTLISETISRYKEKVPEHVEGDVLPSEVEEKKRSTKEDEDEEPNGEEGASSDTERHLHRVSEDDNDYFMI